jgi:hypothetical protein
MSPNTTLFVATATFATTARGREEWITAGQVAEAGSWQRKHFPSAWSPLRIDYFTDPERARHANAETPANVSPAALLKRHGSRRQIEPNA